MKYLKIFVTILALFGISSCARDIIDLTCTIEGIVKDQTTGAPLSNCEILLTPTNKTITTSSDGVYRFTALDLGEYTLTFNRLGYISSTRSVSIKSGETSTVDMLLEAKSSFSLSEEVYDFGDLESSKTFICFNNSASDCSYTLSNLPVWILVNKEQSSVKAGSNDSFTLTIDRSKVGIGSYSQNITVSYSGYINGTTTLLVKMKKVEYTTPSITTATSATTVSESSFSIEGTITGTGGSQITAYGHCWSTSKNPTINGQCTNLGMTDKIGTFKSTIENLSANTTYYVRAYATNNQGTAYGEEIIVKTKSTEVEGPWDGQISDSFAGGSGTFIDPYIIKTGGQLLLMKEYDDGYFKLGNDIDLNNNNWLPFEFRGFFDGNGYTIYNLKIYKNSDDLGLFSYLDCATVENVKINGVEIQALKNSNIGVLAGKARKAVINNCEIYINNTIIGNTNVGGMIGSYEADMYINNCTIKSNELGIIKGNQNVGGFIGCVYKDGSGYSDTKNNHVSINIEGSTCVGGCYGLLDAMIMIYDHSYQGNIRGEKIIGGICGRVNDHVRIISCKSNVNIDASSFTGKDIGGILGSVTYYSHGFYIHACYSTGKISSLDGEAGGLVAYKTYLDNRQDFSIKHCYTTINDNINYSEENSNTSRYKIEECTSVYETNNVSQTMFEFYSEYAKYWNYNNTWTWNGWVDGKEVSISCPKLAWE